ncbi:hypothetical protein [Flavobacterium sp. HJSW_4]|uniref:hypothetical protein n=1 Tax=Flavobacterium sp. HJSW_4 TaxID=3344660 RepID=UPI0035F47209
MKNYIYALVLLILVSCNSKPKPALEEIISDEFVTITKSMIEVESDSVCLNLPLEFKIKLPSSVNYLSANLIDNGHYLSTPNDFLIYNKEQPKKVIFDFEQYLLVGKPFKIIIKKRNHLVSKKDAQELLKKYSKKKSLNNLKKGDTINLIPYDIFRKDNPNFLNELRRIEDKIRITTSCKGEDFFNSQDFKINW